MKRSLSLTLTLLLAFFATGLNAQSSSDNDEDENDLSHRFFMAFHSSTYLDFVSSPLQKELAWTGNIDPVSGDRVYAEVPVQSFNLNIFSFGLEPRFNIREFDKNSALAVSAPISFGLGQSIPANGYVYGVEGMGSFQLPLLAKLYLGSGSTYESEKDFGLSFGGGLEFNKIGLLSMSQETDGDIKTNKGWIMPVATLGVHFWRGYNPVEVNIKYGAGAVKEYYVDKFGEPIEDSQGRVTSGRARSASFRMSISYLLNY